MHTVDIETVMAADIVVNRQSECGVIEAPPSELIKIKGITSFARSHSPRWFGKKSLEFHDLFSQLYPSLQPQVFWAAHSQSSGMSK